MAKINTLNQEQIREINRVNIINILRNKGETTKQGDSSKPWIEYSNSDNQHQHIDGRGASH